MNFKQALEAMKLGHKVKLPNWSGYWCIEDSRTIKMHCKDGRILDIRDTEDIFYTLNFILSDKWMIADEGNCPVANGEFVSTFGFGEAIRNLKAGKKVARNGWNGKNQYIELATNISYKNSKNEIVNAEHDAIGNKAISFIGTSGVQCGWLASQADMLAEDWMIVE